MVGLHRGVAAANLEGGAGMFGLLQTAVCFQHRRTHAIGRLAPRVAPWQRRQIGFDAVDGDAVRVESAQRPEVPLHEISVMVLPASQHGYNGSRDDQHDRQQADVERPADDVGRQIAEPRHRHARRKNQRDDGQHRVGFGCVHAIDLRPLTVR